MRGITYARRGRKGKKERGMKEKKGLGREWDGQKREGKGRERY